MLTGAAFCDILWDMILYPEEMVLVKKKQRRNGLKYLTLSAFFAALIAAAIAYLPKLPIAHGFVHIADSLVFLAASVLPLPYSVFACALGGGLADVLCGYAVYAPASFVIKGVTALFFRAALSRCGNVDRVVCVRNLMALIPSALACCGGYFLYELALYGFGAAIVGIPMNLIQVAVGGALFVLIGLLIDKTRLLSRLESGQ